jgi:putative transposase
MWPALCEEALLHFHNQRYALLAWCVMPNHIHVLVHVWETPLSKMIQSWKRYIATESEQILSERRPPARRVSAIANAPARRAALQTLRWEREYWDTFMRDNDQEKTEFVTLRTIR